MSAVQKPVATHRYKGLRLEVFRSGVPLNEVKRGPGNYGYQLSETIHGSAVVVALNLRIVVEEPDAQVHYCITEESTGTVVLEARGRGRERTHHGAKSHQKLLTATLMHF